MTTFISESRPRARTAHFCDACRGRIAPGETYSKAAMKSDYFYTWVMCLSCIPVLAKAWAANYGDLSDSSLDYDDCHEWAQDNPEDADAAAYLDRQGIS